MSEKTKTTLLWLATGQTPVALDRLIATGGFSAAMLIWLFFIGINVALVVWAIIADDLVWTWLAQAYAIHWMRGHMRDRARARWAGVRLPEGVS